jgi:hypothetical protein
MRPHTVAIIAVLLYYLQNPDAEATEFRAEVLVATGTKRERKRYEFEVLNRKDLTFDVKIGRVWACRSTVKPRYANSREKFFITHDHSPAIKEEIRLYSTSLSGEYDEHARYTSFSTRSLDLGNLEFVSDDNGKYQLEEFEVVEAPTSG